MTTTLPTAIRSRTRTVPSRWSCTTASSASISLPVRMSWWTKFFPPDHLKPSSLYALRSVLSGTAANGKCFLHAASYAQALPLQRFRQPSALRFYSVSETVMHSEVDFEKIHFWCRESKIFHLYELILESCRIYFGLSASIDPQVHCSAADCAVFLEKILADGDFGSDTTEKNRQQRFLPARRCPCLVPRRPYSDEAAVSKAS